MLNKQKICQALTSGLLAGYGGQSKFDTVFRGPFQLKSSSLGDYIDQWVDGGGQELVKVDSQIFTRLYAGGVVDEDVLSQLGIDKKAVIKHLIKRIQTLGSATRLFSDCLPLQENGWDYHYQIQSEIPELNLTQARESLYYQGQLVFVHFFLLSPVNK